MKGEAERRRVDRGLQARRLLADDRAIPEIMT